MFFIVTVIYSCSLVALHLPNACRYLNYTYFLHTDVINFNIWWLILISSIQNLSKMFCPSFHYVSVLGKNVAMLVFHNSWIVGIFSWHHFGDFIEFLDISSPGCFLGFTYTVFKTISMYQILSISVLHFYTISQGFSYSRSKMVFDIIPLFVDVVFIILGF